MTAAFSFRRLAAFVLVSLSISLLPAVPASAKSPHSVKLGAQVGAGYDSNTFNKPYGNESQALGQQATVKAKYGFKISKRVKWNLGAAATNTYRLAGGNAKALKLGIKGQTGVDWKVFGAKSTKKKFKPNGKLAVNFGYSGTFNPTLVPARTPRGAGFVDADGDGIDDADPDGVDDEDPDAIDEDDEVDDATLEDDLSGGEDDDFAEDDDFGDDEEEDEEDGEEEDEEFFDEDPVGNKFFNSKPPRHNLSAAVKFTYQPWHKTKFTFGGLGALTNIGETPGRVTSDAKGGGGSLKFEHVFDKKISLNGGYNLGFKAFDAKTTTGGAKLRMVAHGLGVGAKFKPAKRVKIIPGYRLGYTSVPPNSASNSMFHQGRLGFDYKIIKGLSAFWENNVMYSGRTATSTKDAKRYQTLVGVRGTMGFPKN